MVSLVLSQSAFIREMTSLREMVVEAPPVEADKRV